MRYENIGLTKEEKERGRQWRIEKCGYDSIVMVFSKFKEKYNKKDANSK